MSMLLFQEAVEGDMLEDEGEGGKWGRKAWSR
jgi:hypothetical protein